IGQLHDQSLARVGALSQGLLQIRLQTAQRDDLDSHRGAAEISGPRHWRLVPLVRLVGVRRSHFGKQGFGCNILTMRPSDRTQQYVHLIEIMNVLKLAEDAKLKVGPQIKNSLPSICALDINAIIRQW